MKIKGCSIVENVILDLLAQLEIIKILETVSQFLLQGSEDEVTRDPSALPRTVMGEREYVGASTWQVANLHRRAPAMPCHTSHQTNQKRAAASKIKWEQNLYNHFLIHMCSHIFSFLFLFKESNINDTKELIAFF